MTIITGGHGYYDPLHDVSALVDIHIWLMAFVWLVAAPLAIGIALYGRLYNKSWWGNGHMAIMGTIVTVPLIIGVAAGFIAAKGIRMRPHLVLGTVVVIAAFCQIALGIVNHLIYRRRREPASKKPWHNVLHIWLGRIVALLALINIPLGMRMHHVTLPYYIAYAVWVGFLAVTATVLTYLIIRRKEGQTVTTADTEDQK